MSAETPEAAIPDEASAPATGKHSGLTLEVDGLGAVELTTVLITNAETEIYFTSHHAVLVKMFDLNCGKADEISYGPYLSFTSELENFVDI